MNKLILLGVIVLALALVAQTSDPSAITLSPLGPAANCVSSATGNVLCAANDGFYISVAGGTFQKVQAGLPPTPPSPTSLSCTTASFTTGATGALVASGCTFK